MGDVDGARDTERRQVYCAEDLCAEGTVFARSRSIGYLQDVVDQLIASPWWIAHVGVEPVSVRVNRSDRRSLYSHDRRLISLSPRSLDLNTLCHELAHAAAFDSGVAGPAHGPRFRSLHVIIRRAILGPECADDLAQVYAQFGLSAPSLDDFPEDPETSVLDSSVYNNVVVVGRPAGQREIQNRGAPIAL
jgi:hypothetical protein